MPTRRRTNEDVARPRSASRARYERIYTAIRDRICLLDYEPGRRLSEESLAREWRVSRTPIRRVLTRLEAEGLVESRHGVGTIVTDVDLADMSQIYRLRMELAVLIGLLDPVPPNAEGIARVQEMLRRCDALGRSPDPKRFARLNMDFFLELVAIIGNRPLREISERLYYRTTRVWLVSVPRLDLAREISIFRREIAEIAAAMESGDFEAVGRIRRRHIEMSFNRLLGYTPEAAGKCSPAGA